MTKLSDTQRILLSNAAQRENGSLLPPPPTLTASGGVSKAVAALLKNGLVREHETTEPATAVRKEEDLSYGLFITDEGAAAIGIERTHTLSGSGTPTGATPLPAATPAKTSKSATVLALLGRSEGATLPELIEATSWLPHTTRAALTGLRKKGNAITRGKRDGVTCYTLTASA